jgi:hypothetical protein
VEGKRCGLGVRVGFSQLLWPVGFRVVQVGETWDPLGIAALTFGNNLRYKMSGIVPYAKFMDIRPAIFQRHVRPLTTECRSLEGNPVLIIARQVLTDVQVPDSALSPYNTHQDAFFRFVTAPVYAPTNTRRLKPDMILLAGDMVNGKTALCERILRITNSGYCGYFLTDGKVRGRRWAASGGGGNAITGMLERWDKHVKFSGLAGKCPLDMIFRGCQGDNHLMTSVLIELGTRKVHVDVDIAHDVIKASHAKNGEPVLEWSKIQGQSTTSGRLHPFPNTVTPPDSFPTPSGDTL